jgi:hypothetical protein
MVPGSVRLLQLARSRSRDQQTVPFHRDINNMPGRIFDKRIIFAFDIGFTDTNQRSPELFRDPPAANSQNPLDVSPSEIGANIQQRTVVFFRDFIGEAVAKIQAGGMDAFSLATIGRSNPSRRCRSYGDGVEAEPVDQACDLFADIASRRSSCPCHAQTAVLGARK